MCYICNSILCSSQSHKTLEHNNWWIVTFIVWSEKWRKHCNIPVFISLEVHSWSLSLSFWQLKIFPYSAWSWQLVSDWGKVPLVCVIKCHRTSAVLQSVVLLCLSVLLGTTVPSLLGVFLLHPDVRIEITTAFTVKITVIWNVTPCNLVHIYVWLGGKSYFLLRILKMVYLCPCLLQRPNG